MWACRRERVGALILECRRGDAVLSVNTEQMAEIPRRFELVADASGRRDG